MLQYLQKKFGPKESQDNDKSNPALVMIGSFLREKREARKVSIDQLATYGRIRPGLLEMLEENHLGELPVRTVVRGYIHVYSKILKLNEKDCLHLLDRSYRELKIT